MAAFDLDFSVDDLTEVAYLPAEGDKYSQIVLSTRYGSVSVTLYPYYVEKLREIFQRPLRLADAEMITDTIDHDLGSLEDAVEELRTRYGDVVSGFNQLREAITTA